MSNSNAASIRSATAAMVEGALCIALAVVLSKVNLFALPNGGSVDAGLAPLFIFAWRRGLRWGIAAGALAGVVKVLLGGYIANPVQVVLEYPLAYAMTGLAAAFSCKKPLGQAMGLVLGFLAQTGCHVVAGAIFFAQYAPKGQNPWVYSLLYNAPTLGAKYLLSAAAAWLLWKALERALPKR